jgi:hypothetical protein
MQSTTIMNFVYTILDDHVYYGLALTFICIQAFGIGLAVGYTYIHIAS